METYTKIENVHYAFYRFWNESFSMMERMSMYAADGFEFF